MEPKGSRFISASRDHVRFQKINISQLFGNLNDVHILSMPKFAGVIIPRVWTRVRVRVRVGLRVGPRVENRVRLRVRGLKAETGTT